ncbi:PP2C family serine/threonine-protein phosphatase [Niveispirillum sp. BGYR6]|uniref:PP2C family serine/threonine-protein phosphatase n=1 Tax=Niveispirillum sp. BGYR6 TaxID=2971249 RepID=UPI0022B979AC|nr:PP2C family serine/threonine-protein phosphatase [Niveispirillum sp. BGYR6]MDG5494928.1 PP2C family serine/threonine-protein phosphatase [Niveispirillum sp. BGYR6]
MPRQWRWAGASSIGTSHIKSGLPCQDFVACIEIESPSENVLAVIVSDGAGSASKAEAGARMVCGGFLRESAAYIRAGGRLEDVPGEVAWSWIDSIRDRVNSFSERNGIRPRDCAATMVGLLIGADDAVAIHVGDGAAVVREEGGADWTVPSWPFHGEYASTTTFVTDDPQPHLSVVHIPARLDRFAVFSDGIERMVLDHAKRAAHGPFFDRMTGAVASDSSLGHARTLSHSLRKYLDGKTVCERTDDDKSLVLGVRS